MQSSGIIRIGIGGWTYPPWRGTFYPAKLTHKHELEYASRQLTSIEVNGTYYGSQKPATFTRWHDETPESFVFSLKAPRFATNRRVLAEAGDTIERFFNSGVLNLQDKLGPINWQFMPTHKFAPDDMEAFLELLPEEIDGRKIRHALEVRHESFCSPEFIALARRHEAAIVLAGDARYPQIADATAPFTYIRIMGTKANAPLGYGEGALGHWAARAKTLAAGGMPTDLNVIEAQPKNKTQSKNKAGRDVYLYVISGHKVSNPAAAMALAKRVAGT